MLFRALVVACLCAAPFVDTEAPVAPPLLHHPHDVVLDVDLPPNYPSDPTVFVAATLPVAADGSMNLFLVSRNRGFTWVNSRAGMRGSKIDEFEPASDWAESKVGYAVLGEAGLHRTRDGGRTWETIWHRAKVEHLAVPPVTESGQTLFMAGPGRLFRSDDGGGKVVELTRHLPEGSRIDRLAVSPSYAEDRTVAVATRAKQVLVSSDGGRTWNVAEVPGVVTAVQFSPRFARDRTLWVSTHGASVLRSDDGGLTFVPSSDGLDDPDVNDVVCSVSYPYCPDVFAATRDHGVYRSRDGGVTWELTALEVMKTDQTDNHYRKLALSPLYPVDPTIYCGAFEGLYRTSDAGASWVEANLIPTRIGRGVAYSPNFAEDRTAFAINYGNPMVASTDGGTTWEVRSTDVGSMAMYHVEVSPRFAEDRVVMMGAIDGVRRSEDAGQSWERVVMPPVLRTHRFHTYEIRDIEFSREFAEDQSVYAVNVGGLYKSEDAGRNWTGKPIVGAYRVAVAPRVDGERLLFLGGDELHRSADDGDTWTEPLGRGRIIDVAVATDFASSGEVYALGKSQGFCYSTDRGLTWQVVGEAFDGFSPSALALSPDFERDGSMFVSSLAGGIFASEDRGRTWRRVTAPESPVHTSLSLAVSSNFAQDRSLLAGTFEGVWRSIDAGESWALMTETELYDWQRAPWIVPSEAWDRSKYGKAFIQNVLRCRDAGEVMTLPFTGSGIRLYGVRGPKQGVARILLDGESVAEVDCYAPRVETQAVLYENTDLPWGFHDLTVEVTGRSHPDAKNCWVAIDAAMVVYGSAPEGEVPVFADESRLVLSVRADGTLAPAGEPDPDQSRE